MRIIKKLMRKLITLFLKPTILFESKPPFSDNTKAVYDELVRRGYHKKYYFIWTVDSKECAYFKNGEIHYRNPWNRRSISDKLWNYRIFYHVKCDICCNSFIIPPDDLSPSEKMKRPCFYLSHGTPIKSVKEYYNAKGRADYLLSPSEPLNSLMADQFIMPEERVIATGFARNDVFARLPIELNERFHTNYNKIIIWYPTYRQNKAGTINTGGDSMPVIHDMENAVVLNRTAQEKNTLIILKPHFLQDVSKLHQLNLSNVWLIDESFFDQYGLTSYEMLAGSDALITDYSSVYFDYTLRDRPIAVIWEDIDQYEEFPGFALDLDSYLKGAVKVYNIEELCSFVRDVADGEDSLAKERREVRDLVNFSVDGKNAERAADVIISKAHL